MFQQYDRSGPRRSIRSHDLDLRASVALVQRLGIMDMVETALPEMVRRRLGVLLGMKE